MATQAEIAVLRGTATQVKNESQVGGNTAGRVGGLFEGIVDALPSDEVIDGKITQAVADIQPIVIEGNVDNAPDQEDLTSVNQGGTDVLKFKDKTYSPALFSGLGRVYLRKNVVTPENLGYAINLLTSEMVSQTNTIYRIQYDYNLNGQTITLPANVTLQFEGGSLANGTIVGNNTMIDSVNVAFKKDLTIQGTWKNEVVYSRWFGFISSEDGVTDNSLQFKQLQAVINGTNGCHVEFTKGYYQTQIIQMHPDEKHTIDGVEYDVWWTGSTYNEDRIVLCIKDISYVDINLNGSTIQLINVTCPFTEIFAINNVENSYVHDGIFIGMAIDNFDYPTYADKSWTSPNWNYFTSRNYERCYCIQQRGGFCTIYNVNTTYSTGDGICVGSGGASGLEAKGYLVRDSEVSYCGRNGITLHSSEEGKLVNCHIHHIGSDVESGEIGSDGVMARAPRAGIDVEFEDGKALKPLMEWDSLFIHDSGNKSFSFAAPSMSTMKQFTASNCRFIGLGLPNNISADGTKVFDNCYFEHTEGSIGTLLGSATYSNCKIVAKALLLSVGANTFENCIINDEYTGDGTGFFFTENNEQRIFRNCTLTIKHKYGYVASNKFYNCTLNFYSNDLLYSGGAEFYDCTFNNDPDDATNYSFQFRIGNYAGGLKLVRCSFNKARGYGGGVNDYFFSYGRTYPIIVEGCSFNTLSMYHGSPCGKISFKNCSIGYFSLSGYQQTNTGVETMTMDNCTFENFNVDSSNSLEMKMTNCKVSIVSGGSNKIHNVLFQNCYITNNVTRPSYYADAGVRGISSTFDFVVATNTVAFSLENCYIKGLVTEATFQGTKNACSFETPLPSSGTTTQRPSASVAGLGFKYFDTDLNSPVYSNGTNWVLSANEGEDEVDHGTSDTTFALTPNVLHKWGEVATLTLTLAAGTSGKINEYMFQFTSGSTPTVLTVPNTVNWVSAPNIEASTTYQASIVNNIGVIIGV